MAEGINDHELRKSLSSREIRLLAATYEFMLLSGGGWPEIIVYLV